MSDLQVTTNQEVETVFKKYPQNVRRKMMKLRRLILDSAQEIDGVNRLEETLKWGEPSFLVAKGSTIRMDWKQKNPDQYAIYFKCTSKLVPSFKSRFPDTFKFENNRAIVFGLNDTIPEPQLKKCIKAALTYHRIKHLPNLGL